MRSVSLFAALMLMSAMCAAQAQPQSGSVGPNDGAHGVVASSRVDFGEMCGIQDVSAQRAIALVRSPEGVWSEVGNGRRPGPFDNAVARVWRESNWMVDMHDAPRQDVMTIHTGQMCFDPRGQITLMIDRYMEMGKCGCVRFTSLQFAEDGRVTRRTQRFWKIETGEEIPAPEQASEFPEIWEFRRLEQLPFYPLVKK